MDNTIHSTIREIHEIRNDEMHEFCANIIAELQKAKNVIPIDAKTKNGINKIIRNCKKKMGETTNATTE